MNRKSDRRSGLDRRGSKSAGNSRNQARTLFVIVSLWLLVVGAIGGALVYHSRVSAGAYSAIDMQAVPYQRPAAERAAQSRIERVQGAQNMAILAGTEPLV